MKVSVYVIVRSSRAGSARRTAVSPKKEGKRVAKKGVENMYTGDDVPLTSASFKISPSPEGDPRPDFCLVVRPSVAQKRFVGVKQPSFENPRTIT